MRARMWRIRRALRNVADNLVEAAFGPEHDYRFALRIRLRILTLRFALWRRRPKVMLLRHHWPKPVALAATGIAVPILFGWLLSRLFPEEASGFFTAVHNLLTQPERSRLEWREAAQLLLLLVGIPSAFLLWLFRDINVSGTLDNQRKDVNLKEFQEIQMRAAGAMDEKLPAAARETLQIAALHQLRAFLRGEYGKSFRRPAFELLRARFVASAEATGTQAVYEWLQTWRRGAEADDACLPDRIQAMKKTVADALGSLNPSRVAETERSILYEEWEAMFRSGLPISGAIFDGIWLDASIVLADLRVADCRFIAANLSYAHFENAALHSADFGFARLNGTHFEGALLMMANFEGASLYGAHLEHARLHRARFEGADLRSAHLHGASLSGACLAGANMRGASFRDAFLHAADLRNGNLEEADLEGATLADARLEGAQLPAASILPYCTGASFDVATTFAADWEKLSQAERDAARAPWLERGAQWNA